ncbi:hypothetical protein SLS59_000657 [Nothophoma quercina]|uniref:Haloacid dehalogenase-like hydrolase n=1 Tax=Nothophoma quercina TaxID=749835 RepID=A0ABR3S2V6_9PLEO
MAAKTAIDPNQPIHWILDWDGTITRRDTLDALVSIAASSKPDSPVLDEWKRVSEAYMSDYTAAMEKLAPNGNLPKTIREEKKLLQALSSVEQASLDRVSSSRIFAGLTSTLLEEGGRSLIESNKVEIRQGFPGFLKSMQSQDHDALDLLSVNWSRHFISSCLQAASTPIEKGAIYANELDGIAGHRPSTGNIIPFADTEKLIMSSGDKLQYLGRLRQQYHEARSQRPNSGRSIVYVGDSWTDIECLLEADLGICIRDEPGGSSQKKLAERLKDLGIHVPHIQDWKDADQWQVVWAKDFAEVQTWIKLQVTRTG